ncbi:hypothetical protein NEOKW01_1192 [Nematocida sp. AWRm80]|nr:hypothetical protein NEOKW01_1192 [Nematocida sp. AWRm80]
MNPFNKLANRQDNSTVQLYFSMVQRKNTTTRTKGIEQIIDQIDKLDKLEVEECLYDIFPVLCKEKDSKIVNGITKVLILLLERRAFKRIIKRFECWLTMFIDTPHELGEQLLKQLQMYPKGLSSVLEEYSKHSKGVYYLESKRIEGIYLRYPEIQTEIIDKIISTDTREIVSLISLLRVLTDKYNLLNRISTDTERLIESLNRAAERIGKKRTREKWKIYSMTRTGFNLEELQKESAEIDPEDFEIFVNTSIFVQEVIEKQDTVRFLTNCLYIPPETTKYIPGTTENVNRPSYYSSINSTNDVSDLKDTNSNQKENNRIIRETIIKKAIHTNYTRLEEISISLSDFPFLNTIEEYTKVNTLLSRMEIDRIYNKEYKRLYNGLTDKESIIRASILNHSITEIDKEIENRIDIKWLRDNNLVSEGAQVLSVNFFNQQKGLLPVEILYIAAVHKEYIRNDVIDIMIKNKVFISEILSNLSEEQKEYLLSQIHTLSVEEIKEVYSLIREKTTSYLNPDQEYIIMNYLYQDKEYQDKRYKGKKVLKEEDQIDQEYLIYLIRREGVDLSSILIYIAREANKQITGTQDISDTYTATKEILSGSMSQPTTHEYLFQETRTKWTSIVETIATETKEEMKKTALTYLELINYQIPHLTDEDISNRNNSTSITLEDLKRVQEQSTGGIKYLCDLLIFHRQLSKDTNPINTLLSSLSSESSESSESIQLILNTFLDTLLNKNTYTIPNELLSILENTSIYSLIESINIKQLPTISLLDTNISLEEYSPRIHTLILWMVVRILKIELDKLRKTDQSGNLDRLHKDNKVVSLCNKVSKEILLRNKSTPEHSKILSLAITICTEYSLELFQLDWTHLSTEAILKLERYVSEAPEQVCLAIKRDSCWNAPDTSNLYRTRIYKRVLESIAEYYSNTILNMFSLSRAEENAISSEVFYLMFDISPITDIKRMNNFEWTLFLMICSKIRSLDILTLISIVLRSEKLWLPLLARLETSNLELLRPFATAFPKLIRVYHQTSRNAQEIEEYIIKNITLQLIQEESKRPLQGVTLKIKTVGKTYILMALYKIEESVLEVNIHFPNNYPLGTPTIHIIRSVGLKKQRLERLLQKIRMLLTEYCRISEALVLWKVFLDKNVDEANECSICFFMVDEVSKYFPDTDCPHCSNKFHSHCLRQWLKKSKDLCPICRKEIR